MNFGRRVKRHQYIPYPKGSVFAKRKTCVRCGMPEHHVVHETTEKEK